MATLDTTIYGVDYHQGEEVDTEGWNRKQELQFLGLGLMAPLTTEAETIAAASYIHSQLSVLSVWTINHPLLFTPNVMVIDSAGGHVYGDVLRVSASVLQITFRTAFSGTAYLS